MTLLANPTGVQRVEVAVPVPTIGTYSFSVPKALSHKVGVGQRIIVPFQGRLLVGYIVALDPAPLPHIKLKPITLIVDEEQPTFSTSLVEFLTWVAHYYQAPIGDVFRGAHPSGTNPKGEPALTLTESGTLTLPGMYSGALENCVRALKANSGTLALSDLPETPTAHQLRKWLKLGIIEKSVVLKKPRIKTKVEAQWSAVYSAPTAPRGRGGRALKRDLLHATIAEKGPIRISVLRQEPVYTSSALKQLSEDGAIACEFVTVDQDLFAHDQILPDVPPQLNQQQREAVNTITKHQGFGGFLLRGVTGSGKTEVYLRVIEATLKQNQGALVLVPEIALTPQLVQRFRARLGDGIAVLHSGMSDQKRLAHWSRLQSGEVKLAIGARSAVFAPIPNLGMIVVDEEHDHSFKQGDGVRYHGRDLAIMRAYRAQCPVILGSATPSLESLQNVNNGKLSRLDLTERATGGTLPRVELIDLRTAPKLSGSALSKPMVEAIEATLNKHEQVIIFLNRRGFSTFALCEACGDVVECNQCSISMTWHKGRNRLACHYCDAARPLPKTCPSCGKDALVTLGAGTEKIEETLKSLFPKSSVARLDRDTAMGNGLNETLARMKSRDIDILVGTQMVTKGHDFPHVTLVCVLDADAGLKLPDFRSGERTVQLLTQVAGRAGRGDQPGKVLIQSYDPEHHALQSLQTHDHEGFIEREAQTRSLFGYPPYQSAVVIRTEGKDASAVAVTLRRFAQFIQENCQNDPALLRGPAPAIVERIRGKSRWALLVTHTNRRMLHEVIRRARKRVDVPASVRVIVDVDPVDLM
ncbi:MAG: replication restart helicase PriA [Bradymonadia bacterium]